MPGKVNSGTLYFFYPNFLNLNYKAQNFPKI
jgi:hypothetical protein